MHIEAPCGVWIQTVLLIVCNNSICLVYVYRMGWKIKGMTTLFCEHKQTQKGNIEINVLNENIKKVFVISVQSCLSMLSDNGNLH